MAEKQIFNGETDRLVGVATPTPLMNCCFAGNTNFLVIIIIIIIIIRLITHDESFTK